MLICKSSVHNYHVSVRSLCHLFRMLIIFASHFRIFESCMFRVMQKSMKTKLFMSRRNLPAIFEQRIRQVVKVWALSRLLQWALVIHQNVMLLSQQLNKLSGTGFSGTRFVSRARSINKIYKLTQRYCLMTLFQ